MRIHEFFVIFAICTMFLFACAAGAAPENPGGAAGETISNYCKDIVGPPRVEKISESVWVALGYDLASTVVIQTDEGSVIVDTGMSPARAREMRAALEEEIQIAPVAAIVYTHSHIDHIGGATVWAEEATPIWSTAALPEHLMKQYGSFMEIESIRGGRQFGRHVPDSMIPCSALGRRVDIEAALENGVLLPTDTFSGEHTLEIGGRAIELHEAHGETHDTLFVWLPDERTLISGDNFYWSFPNLYTLRGTSPRPVEEWIASIDAMRALAPEHLVPNHTLPVNGEEKIAEVLTNYRDAIQWVRDHTIRRANRGEDMDEIAENVSLPPHLAELPYNREFYGQVDWSAKAIYSNNLGWFDGRPEALYPLPRSERLSREISLMGGVEKVFTEASAACEKGDHKWAIHLLTKLKYSDIELPVSAEKLNGLLAECYEKLAHETVNTNGRAYLLESAYELDYGLQSPPKAGINERLADSIPLDHIFKLMALRLDSEKSMDVHQSVMFVFNDEKKRYIVTVRHGIAEVVEGKPLPGTPKPVATLRTDAGSYRRMALGLAEPGAMLSSGKLRITGSMEKFMKFMSLFDTGM